MFDRRSFMKFIGGAGIGIMATPTIWYLLDDLSIWTQNWGWIPRVPKGPSVYIPSVSKLSPSGSYTYVRSVHGQPVRTFGNNESVRGAASALDIANAQLHYSPARLKRPLKRGPDGGYNVISWEEADKILASKFEIAYNSQSLVSISGDKSNGVMNDILSAFTLSANSDNFFLMPYEEQSAYLAFQQMGGKGRVAYDLENSDYILSVGANFMEDWGTVMRNRNIFNATHPIGEDSTLKIAVVAPFQNSTVSVADRWLAMDLANSNAFLLTLANSLIGAGKKSSLIGYADFASFVTAYTPEKLEAQTGIPAKAIHDLVAELLVSEKPIVLVGSSQGQASVTTVMLGLAVNILLGSLGREGGIYNLPDPARALPNSMSFENMMKRDLVAYARKVASEAAPAPELLITYNANPIYALPVDSKISDLYAKAKYKIAFSNFYDESCAKSDLVIPVAMDFERFDDVYTPYGSRFVTYAAGQPIISPSYESKPAYEIFLGALSAFGFETGFETIYELMDMRARRFGTDLETVLEGEILVSEVTGPFCLPIFATDKIKANLASLEKDDANLLPIKVMLNSKLCFGTSESAIPPFNTKTFTDYELKGKYSVAQMNKQTARKLRVKAGDFLKLENEFGSCKVLVSLYEGVIPDALILASNLGHTAFDEFSQNKGVNIMQLCKVSEDNGLSTWSALSVNASKA